MIGFHDVFAEISNFLSTYSCSGLRKIFEAFKFFVLADKIFIFLNLCYQVLEKTFFTQISPVPTFFPFWSAVLYTFLLQINYVAKVVVAKVTWRKLCGESCCGESYVAKVAVAKFVAKVIVPIFWAFFIGVVVSRLFQRF